MNRFDKLLLTEMRLVERSKGTSKLVNNKGLKLAMLDSDNLNAIGYELKGESLIALAEDYSKDSNMTPLYVRVQTAEPAIKVNPMYVNFPKQVLEMSDFEYRTNQLAHYMSTYGIETIFDVEVKKGWLPTTETPIERVEDTQIANLKMLEYLTSSEIDERVVKGLIGRKERLEAKEIEIAKAVVLRTDKVIDEIPFKENIGLLYGEMLLTGSLEAKYVAFADLSKIAKHPGDVLDLVEYMVISNKYRQFKTSVKRGLVNLIESFSDASIEENLASNRWSKAFLGKHGKARAINRNIALIDYLSFSRFSKNSKALELVTALKNGELVSWNQKLEYAYKNKNLVEVRSLLNERPGTYFRQINRLASVGVNVNDIIADSRKFAGELKLQSIVSALNNFEGDKQVDKVFFDILVSNLKSKNVEELKGKKVFIDEKNVDFSRSKLEITDKFAEGGYISNGMAIRIPEDAKFLRFFTYWNHVDRVDIDLHGVSTDTRGNETHIGWHGRQKGASLVHSGDITHSNASEYIDMNLEQAAKNNISKVQFNINSYTKLPFSKIDTVFTGLMVMSEMGETVNLHDAKNLLFRHDLEYKSMSMDYGMVDFENKVIYVGGKPSDKYNDTNTFDITAKKLSIETYLNLLLATQGAIRVETRDEADMVFGLDKSDEENYVCLIDNNFYM